MDVSRAALLFLAGVAGGGMNAIVGGGTFVAFPALLFAGVPAVSASATTTLALWPGGLGSLFAYRADLGASRRLLLALGLASAAGGVLGATALLRTSDAAFVRAVPWLLLLATALFTFGGRLTAALRGRGPGRLAGSGERGGAALLGLALVQAAIAVYGAYFGGGMGIMMLAAWTAAGMTDLHAMNALRTALGAVLNGVAVVSFVLAGRVAWGPGAVVLAGALFGGYFGAHAARRTQPAKVRRLVVALAWAMTAYFFVRAG